MRVGSDFSMSRIRSKKWQHFSTSVPPVRDGEAVPVVDLAQKGEAVLADREHLQLADQPRTRPRDEPRDRRDVPVLHAAPEHRLGAAGGARRRTRPRRAPPSPRSRPPPCTAASRRGSACRWQRRSRTTSMWWSLGVQTTTSTSGEATNSVYSVCTVTLSTSAPISFRHSTRPPERVRGCRRSP